jgi:hypothetical protein
MGRRLIALLVLVGVVASLVPAAGAQIITSVERRNPDNNSGDTEVVIAPAPLADKSVAMVDRTHVYTPVPEELLGAEYVMLANDDKDNANFELHITIGQAGTLYVLLDNRVGTNTGGQSSTPNPTAAGMTWMTQMGFVDTGLDVGIDESNDGDIDNYYSVFSKQVTPGVVILKAQNDTFTGGPGSRNMYGVAAAPPRVKASKPSPADGEEGLTMPLFQWTPGTTAVLHNVYLGTSPELTEADLVGPSTVGTAYYHTAPLIPGMRYFWRVDEVEADLTTVHTGDVWSFVTASITAFQPAPADGVKWVDPNTELTWKPGKDAVTHDLYLDTDKAAVEAGTSSVAQKGFYLPTWKPAAPLSPGVIHYWRVDETAADGTKTPGAVWSFTTLPAIPIADESLLAWWKMDEEGGATVVDWSGHGRHATFATPAPTWTTGHFGSALQLAGNGETAVYPDGSFLNGLDAVTITAWVKSDVTNTDRGFLIFENPSGGDNRNIRYDAAGSSGGGTQVMKMGLTVAVDATTTSNLALEASNGSQSTDWQHLTLVWQSGQALQFYINGKLDAPTSNSTAATGTLTGASTVIIGKGCKDTATTSWDGLIDEIRIYDKALTQEEIQLVMRGDPLLAWDPSPANGSTTDEVGAVPFTWQAGDQAVRHDVYLGTDAAAVAAADASDTTGIYRGRQSGTSFTPSPALEWGLKYFWRIDEVNGDDSISPGFVWSFTLADYLIVDEFESYNDDEGTGTRIYETWIDGYTDELSGSIVGNLDPPFAEQTIVHGGKQSMPMDYNNIGSPYFISQAYREFSPLANWTVGGVNDLSLWVRGRPVSFLQTASGFTMSGAGTDIFNATDEFRFAFKSLNGNGTIFAKVESVDNTNAWAKAGVMIRETLDADSRYAFVCATPGNGVRFQGRLLNAGDATSDSTVATAEQIALKTPVWVKLERSGTSFSGFYSTDGVNWTPMVWNPQTITMNTAYIGVAVTSHSAGVLATAVFSDITTSGSVSSSWQTVEVGVAQPGNAQDDLYLGVEDSAGKLKIVTNPDPTVVTSVTWTEWKIPLSSLTGVNLSKVKRIYVGVGDKENPAAGGTGRIYIDDIRVVRPAP